MDGEELPRPRVFCSYAHEDHKFAKKVVDGLVRLQKRGFLHDVWFDELALAGDVWEEEIRKKIEAADIIIFLVSQDFFASEFCVKELTWAMERAQEGARVVPLIVRSGVDFEGEGLPRHHALVQVAGEIKPVESWQPQSGAYRHISRKIRELAQAATAAPAARARLWGSPKHEHPERVYGRDRFLEAVRTMLVDDPGRAVVLTGTGGAGKSTVALEYARRYGDKYRYMMWLRAESPEEFLVGRVQMAGRLELPASDLELTARAFGEWLATNDRWLLILDNAADLESVRAVVPAESRGHIMLTSRSSTWGEEVQQMSLSRLRNDDAVDMVIALSGLRDRKGAQALVKELSFNPEALQKAARTMHAKGWSYEDYLARYRQSVP